MKLIVGLGNPGAQYDKTRHNVGFMVLDNYVKKLGLEFNKNKFNGDYCEYFYNDEKVIFLKPLSFMNLSGEVVSKFVSYFKIDVEDILVINDDLDLVDFKIRLRQSGSSGGHNGLKNIEFHLATDEYKRMKIGIGNNKNLDTKNYVLGTFSSSEYDNFLKILPLTENIINDFFSHDFHYLMSKYN